MLTKFLTILTIIEGGNIYFAGLIEKLIAKLDAQVITLEDAEKEILANMPLYTRPSLDDGVNAWIKWEEQGEELAHTLTKINKMLESENDPKIILTKRRIGMIAGELLGANARGKTSLTAGYRLWSLNKYEKALEPLECATLLLKNDEPLLSAMAMSYNIDCLCKLNRHDEVIQKANTLILVADEKGFEGIKALAMRDMGTAQSNLGQNEQAARNLDKALALRLRLSPDTCEQQSVTSEATFYRAIALAARARGDFTATLNAFEEAWRIYLREKNDREAAYMLSEIGITWDLIGERERAHEHLEKAAQEAERLHMFEESSRWRGNLPEVKVTMSPETLLAHANALLRADSPETRKARELARQCINHAISINDIRLEVEARNLLAATYSEEDNLFQAMLAQKSTIRAAEKLNDSFRLAQLITNLGNILTRLGMFDKAEKEYKRALEMVRPLREKITTSEMRQATGAGIIRIYEQLALLLIGGRKHDKESSTQSRLKELFEITQEIRGVNLIKWLIAEQEVEKDEDNDLCKKLLELRAADILLEMATFEGKIEIQSLIKAQEVSEKAFQEIMWQKNKKVMIKKAINSVDELSHLLKPDECLIDLFGISEGIIIMRINYDGTLQSGFCVWNREERLKYIKRWESVIAQGKILSQTERSYLKEKEATFSILLEELRNKLIQNIATLLIKDTLPHSIFIVPHCELFQLPFWVLTETRPDLSISILPASNALGILRKRQRTITEKRLAVGDVTKTLKHVQGEIDSLPNFNTTSMSIRQFIQDMTTTSLVHFAGHGEFNAQQPYLSGIVLEKDSHNKPSLFSHQTIFGEELFTVAQVLGEVSVTKCFLVTFSACSTGIPRRHPASEFVSIPTAFLIAGSRNVIASLWPVNDGFARLLMKKFYEFFLSGNEIINLPSTALAMARNEVSKMPLHEVIKHLGGEQGVPEADPPYAGAWYTMAFEHFGVD